MVATNANGQSTSVMTALYQALMPATAEYWRKLDHSLNSRQELCAWLNEALNWWEQHKHILDRKSTRLNSSHIQKSRMPSSA